MYFYFGKVLLIESYILVLSLFLIVLIISSLDYQLSFSLEKKSSKQYFEC